VRTHPVLLWTLIMRTEWLRDECSCTSVAATARWLLPRAITAMPSSTDPIASSIMPGICRHGGGHE
jgi:hypothetical protein